MRNFIVAGIIIPILFFGFIGLHIYFWDWISINIHLYLVFGFIIGFFDAVKDTLAHHFDTSIFKNYEVRFWDPSVSWKYKLKAIDMSLDAWHIAKMLQTLFICLTVIFYIPSDFKIIDFILIYLSYKAAFNLFYSLILKSDG